ncbi:hypothetical protein GZH47_07295 [Paenibacillus rhizovicinus]|uniref:HTH LytTR-type domain-containing protein n=1 Tax=Paenibacillus rhizovicinus TaxID=2704463 RepID=A0A6C0NX20_9BACL|nr:LytTR family transcriptional regulator DNA-binding domain-containing protein [Paenibacillus rhizovicinus]QHW30681.1 hypothetical protein GZH47_07295 [Paenibacillus rhizovicinus]
MKLFLRNESGESEWVGIADICLISPTVKGPAFTAKNGSVYTYPHTMEQLVRHFANYGFQRLDRNAIANLDAAKEYDPIQRKLVFDAPDNGENLYATVSIANEAKVKHLIVRECADPNSAYSAA